MVFVFFLVHQQTLLLTIFCFKQPIIIKIIKLDYLPQIDSQWAIDDDDDDLAFFLLGYKFFFSFENRKNG